MSVTDARREANTDRVRRAYAGLLLDALAYERTAFENDTEVNGGDLVEWFAGWRLRAQAALDQNGDGRRVTQRCLGEPSVTAPAHA